MTFRDRFGWGFVFALALTIPAPTRAGYVIVDLGIAAPGSATVATAISDSGAVAGWVSAPSGTSALVAPAGQAFQYVKTASLPGITPVDFGTPYSIATGVNSSGNVVGTYTAYDERGIARSHAFATVNGTAKDFGNLTGTPLAGASTRGVAIDSGGTILATAYLGGSSTAFRASSPGAFAPIALPTGGSNGIGAGMNASGTAVVNYTNGQGVGRIFVSTGLGSGFDLLSQYTTRGFGLNAYASGIASNGDVAGYGDFNGRSHAFLATAGQNGAPGQFIDIGTAGGFDSSKALGLNKLGQVVGEMDASGYNAHAFLYDQIRGLLDLNSLLSSPDARVWTLTAATGINDSGQIVGQGIINGQLHGFLLTPTIDPGPSPNSTPAPPSLILAAAGLASLGGWARLKRGRTSDQGIA